MGGIRLKSRTDAEFTLSIHTKAFGEMIGVVADDFLYDSEWPHAEIRVSTGWTRSAAATPRA